MMMVEILINSLVNLLVVWWIRLTFLHFLWVFFVIFPFTSSTLSPQFLIEENLSSNCNWLSNGSLLIKLIIVNSGSGQYYYISHITQRLTIFNRTPIFVQILDSENNQADQWISYNSIKIQHSTYTIESMKINLR